MGVYSTTAADAYADKIKAVYEYLDEIRKVADRLSPVEDLASFRAQIEALYAQLNLLVEASTLIATATPTGEAILTGNVRSIQTLLKIGDMSGVPWQSDLDAGLAALESRINALLGGMTGRVNGIDLTVINLDQYRLIQQSQVSGLQIDYTNVAAGLATNQTNTALVLSRLVVQEQFATLTDQRLNTISQNLVSTTTGLQANNSIQAGHTASITSVQGSIVLQAASIDSLSSTLTNVNTGVTANATALSLMQTTVTGIGQDLTAQSRQTTALRSVIGGSGNLLPNADFGAGAAGWNIVVAEEDWAASVLTVDTFNMPIEVHVLEVLGAPSPLGQVVVRSPTMLAEASRYYMVSGYPCVDNGTVSLSYKVFSDAELVVDQGTCPATFNTTTNLNFSAYTRTWVKFLIPVGGTKLRLYLNGAGDGDWISRIALFRPMVERAWVDQIEPSAWTPNVAGAIDGLEGGVKLVEAVIINEIITSANKNAATASALNVLTARMVTTNDRIDASAQALDATNVNVGIVDRRVTTEANRINSLTATIDTKTTTFTQISAPPITNRVFGDTWIDTDDGNKLYTWNGTAWVERVLTSGVKVFAQITAPPSIDRIVGDLWYDTDDSNKLYRWNGTIWVDVTDQRVVATAQALEITKARVEAVNDRVSTEADKTVLLTASIGTKTTTFTQAAAPSATGRVIGDTWIDTDDSNKLYTWNGSVWEVRVLTAGISVFAQIIAPSAIGRMIGDLWYDTDDSNKSYRWNGTAWVEITDPRTAATASALEITKARVEQVNDNVNVEASRITTLSSTVHHPVTGLPATASATSSLTTRANTVEGKVGTLESRWNVTLDVNGYVSGLTSVNNGSFASFTIVADSFRIIAPGHAGRTLFAINNDGNNTFSNDMYLGNGRIVLSSATHMKVLGIGFGVGNEFIEWFGPKMLIANCSRATAISYLTRTGDAYFGGSLTAGVFKTGVVNPSLSNPTEIINGPLGTRGAQITVVCSYGYSENHASSNYHFGDGGGVCSGVLSLYRKIGAGVETLVYQLTVNGGLSIVNEYEPGSPSFYNMGISGSFTYLDQAYSIEDRTYRATLTSRQLKTVTFTPRSGGSGLESQKQISQEIAINTTEQ